MKIKNPHKLKSAKIARRHRRVRFRVSGTAEKPRLSVFRSLKHVTAQLIDDTSGKTLAYAQDTDGADKFEKGELKGKVAKAYATGRLLAERARKAGVTQVVFDRGGRKYHGRVAALAKGARDGGLIF